ncbi:MAG: HNH endonuclease [Gaiellaceae bacterium]
MRLAPSRVVARTERSVRTQRTPEEAPDQRQELDAASGCLPCGQAVLDEDNLQTLCWRCNRTKSNKLPVG